MTTLTIKPSQQLVYFYGAIAAILLIIVAITPISPLKQLPLVLSIMAYWSYQILNVRGWSLQLSSQNQWVVEGKITRLKSYYRSPWLVVLCFEQASVLVTPDNLSPADYRWLRRQLR